MALKCRSALWKRIAAIYPLSILVLGQHPSNQQGPKVTKIQGVLTDYLTPFHDTFCWASSATMAAAKDKQ